MGKKYGGFFGIMAAGALALSGIEALADNFLSGKVENSRIMHCYLGDYYVFNLRVEGNKDVETVNTNDVRTFYVINETEAKKLVSMVCDGNNVEINITPSRSMGHYIRTPATLEDIEFSIIANQVVKINGKKP